MRLIRSKYFSFIITWLFVFNVNAQDTWEKIIYDPWGNSLYLQIANMDIKFDSLNNKYIFLGRSTAQGYLAIYELSADSGNFLFRNYYNDGGWTGQNLKFVNNDEILISSGQAQTSTLQYKTLFKLDSNYNIIWKYQYQIPLALNYCGLTETSDNSILLAGSIYNSSLLQDNPFMLKTDSLGNILHYRIYNNLKAITKSFTETKDKNYLIGINSYNNSLGNTNLGFALIKTDTIGAVLWSKSYLRPNGYMYDFIQKENGNIIILGNTDSAWQAPIRKMFVMELDTGGNVVWCNVYGDNIRNLAFYPVSFTYPAPPMKIIKTIDGGYVITTGIIVPSTYISAALLKIDSLGNVEWEKRYSSPTAGIVGIDLMQTPDSGYFMVCSWNGSNAWEKGYYVIKTDASGNVAGCVNYSDTIPFNSISFNDSSITVTDSIIIINRYIANVHDTTDLPPIVLDGCVPVGFEELVFNTNGILVYPNPSSGIFHLQQKTNDVIEKTEVFNCMGQRVFYKEGSINEIDLSKEQTGIYFYLLKAKQGKSLSGKIIKE